MNEKDGKVIRVEFRKRKKIAKKPSQLEPPEDWMGLEFPDTSVVWLVLVALVGGALALFGLMGYIILAIVEKTP